MKKLTIIDADTLMTTPLPVSQFVVEGLLPQGLHILAGAAKVGKSWLALWLCLQVAKGEPIWNLPSRRGTVLYLCLEDSLSRIQARLFQITEEAPSSLYFATMAGSIGNGLEEQIEEFLQAHPDTVLVVIDTLQKVRIANTKASAYANDYQELSSLKRLADQACVAILAIHHIHKTQDEDPFNRISGTTGISGVTDTNFVLLKKRRGGTEATLYCVGRDIAYQELSLRFQKETHLWELTEPMEETESTPMNEEVLKLFKFLKEQAPFDGTATELAVRLEKRTGEQILPCVLSKKLARHTGDFSKLGVTLSSTRTRDSRALHIRCDSNDGSDGKKDGEPVEKLLSQPSHLSPEESPPL